MTGALASADTMRDLVSRSAADMGMRCIALQRQYIEHCGIEADFGCRVLAQACRVQWPGDKQPGGGCDMTLTARAASSPALAHC